MPVGLFPMSHAIQIQCFGGPEVLKWQSVDVPQPGSGEVRVRNTAVGVNFIDVYHRTGLYPLELPAIPGREAAGVIEAVGPQVRHFAEGDRVAYVSSACGTYTQHCVMPAARLVRLPDAIADEQAAAMMLKGLTAQMLLRRIQRVRRSEFIVIHAAAGGVGLIAVQWAKHLGARVIAIVGSEAKAALVKSHQADHVLQLQDDWPTQVQNITRGCGVSVVYDSVGKDTFMRSLDCLQPRGLMVTYGNASGPVPPIAPLELQKRHSLFLTRPTLFDYIATQAELRRAATELFDQVLSGAIKIHLGQKFPLQEAARAHRALEARETVGSTVLIP